MSADGLNSCESPRSDTQDGCGGQSILPENIEINNKKEIPNISGINNGMDEEKAIIQKPKVKEIVISRPVATGKERPNSIEKAVFDF